MSIRGGDDPIALELLKLLGCPKHVQRLEYVAGVDLLTVVTVTYTPEIADGAGGVLAPVRKTFRLEPIEGAA